MASTQSQGTEPGNPAAPVDPQTRVTAILKVAPGTISNILSQAPAMPAGEPPSPALALFLNRYGIQMDPADALIVNETNGTLLVNTTRANLDQIKKVLVDIDKGK